MEFKKTIKLEISDYTAFNIFTLKRVFLLLPIISILLTYLVFYREDPNRDLLRLFILAVVITALSALGFYALLQHTMKKSFKTNKVMQFPQEVILDDTGVHAVGEFGTTNMSWEDIHKVSETKKAFYVYLVKVQALIIPKRLTSAEENAVIRSIAKKYLSPDKYKLKEV